MTGDATDPVRWLRGDTPFLKSKIKSLEEELRQIHTHHGKMACHSTLPLFPFLWWFLHPSPPPLSLLSNLFCRLVLNGQSAMLMEEVRQMRARRAKEAQEFRQTSLSQSKELQKVVEKMKKASSVEMEALKKKMSKGFEEEKRHWKEVADKEKAKAVKEVEGREREAATRALEDQGLQHQEELRRVAKRHEEEMHRLRQEQQDLEGATYTEEEVEQEVSKAVAVSE